jgi:hypothetical protein
METPSGWVGSWDKAALDQFVKPADVAETDFGNTADEPVPVAIDAKMQAILHRALIRSGKVITPPAAQPPREWVGLTDEEIETIWKKYKTEFFAIKEVEAKLKEKNT